MKAIKTFTLEKGSYTPAVLLDAEKNLIQLSGKTYPENTFEFYGPILDWIEAYLLTKPAKTLVNFDLSYINSSSIKSVHHILHILNQAKDETISYEINWIFDEEDDITEETGEDFIVDFQDLNINLVTKN